MNYEQAIAAKQAAMSQFATTGSAVGYANEAKRESEIPGAMMRLDSRISELQDAIHTLEGRLTGSVARSSAPANPQSTGLVKACMQTGFGTHLDAMNERVVSTYLTVRDLIDRLEV